jgi:hypothetical protein
MRMPSLLPLLASMILLASSNTSLASELVHELVDYLCKLKS